MRMFSIEMLSSGGSRRGWPSVGKIICTDRSEEKLATQTYNGSLDSFVTDTFTVSPSTYCSSRTPIGANSPSRFSLAVADNLTVNGE